MGGRILPSLKTYGGVFFLIVFCSEDHPGFFASLWCSSEFHISKKDVLYFQQVFLASEGDGNYDLWKRFGTFTQVLCANHLQVGIGHTFLVCVRDNISNKL